MKPAHLPRRFAILILFLLVAFFLVGNVLVFTGAHAASAIIPTPTVSQTPSASPSVAPSPTPIPASADTTGILILGILLVAVILLGLLWGRRLVRR